MVQSGFRDRQSAGLSLVELLVTAVMSTVILSVTLGLIVTQRRQYLNQQSATDVGQTLQAGMEMMGNDIREAGEYAGIQTGLPILLLTGGATGAPNLVIQRKLIGQELNVCQDITAGTSISAITVAIKGDLNCGYSDGDAIGSPGYGIPDDVQEWKAFRCQQDGDAGCKVPPPPGCQLSGGSGRECAIAYLYDAVKGQGQFFAYVGERAADSKHYQILVERLRSDLISSDPLFTAGYSKTDRPRLYILDQRQYSLSAPNAAGDRILQLQFTDAQHSASYKIVNQLRDLQIRILSRTLSGTVYQDQFNAGSPPGDPWRTVQAVEVTLSAANSAPNAATPLQSFTSTFYPRNAASRP